MFMYRACVPVASVLPIRAATPSRPTVMMAIDTSTSSKVNPLVRAFGLMDRICCDIAYARNTDIGLPALVGKR